jgi:hexosaminidase
VSTFLEKLLSDIIPRVSPYSAYFHTGGDEVNANAYTLDETVNSSSVSVLAPLLQKFVDRNHAQLRAAGLVPIVWEEMLLQWGLTLGDDVVVQTWISEDSLSQVTAAGHKALFGNYGFWVSQLSRGITY